MDRAANHCRNPPDVVVSVGRTLPRPWVSAVYGLGSSNTTVREASYKPSSTASEKSRDVPRGRPEEAGLGAADGGSDAGDRACR
jgi:hypothetical protein